MQPVANLRSGIALHCQRAGGAPERMEIRVARDGSLDLHVGTLATSQGHETMFAQMASQWLGVPMASIRVVQGDTDKLIFGKGSFAQRSMSTGGSALRVADQVDSSFTVAGWGKGPGSCLPGPACTPLPPAREPRV